MTEPTALVLVHGWKSHPGVWKRMKEKISLPDRFIWSFDYSDLHDSGIYEIAKRLKQFIHEQRKNLRYTDPIDIVCHSMGGYVTRYYLEVMDRKKREEKVRQIIEIGVPNRGSSMAEIFNDPNHGPSIIQVLCGEFVPEQYIPAEDTNVQGIRIRSRETEELCKAGLRPDIRYRNILAANKTGESSFFPTFEGKTWVMGHDKQWRKTWLGDGVIPYADTYLPGTEFDLIPVDPLSLETEPYHYCHIHLPKNPEVIKLVTRYIKDPTCPSTEVFPDS
ncbi:MAG: acetyltransferase [Methanomicrobiales archaeon]|mgnify:CR=1 FL=1|nr:acetyltransferase [Methanomicrobiales archaeon]